MVKPDLNKLKEEIETRKREKNIASSSLGESVGDDVTPRDVFLNGLLTSLSTGRESPSTNLVKIVENKVAMKKGETAQLRVNENVNVVPEQRQPIPMPTVDTIDMSPERDEQLFRDLEMRRKQTLAESMSEYIQTPVIGTPMKNQPQQYSTPVAINEQYLAENVKKLVNNYLAESLSPIFEAAIKDTILEMYAVDRIKEVLNEVLNKETVKPLVYEVIREIQAKSRQKRAQ